MGFDDEQLNNGDFQIIKLIITQDVIVDGVICWKKTNGLFGIMNQPIRGIFST